MSFADSMNSLDAMNDDEIVINEIRLPSFKTIALKFVSLFKPERNPVLGNAATQQQPRPTLVMMNQFD